MRFPRAEPVPLARYQRRRVLRGEIYDGGADHLRHYGWKAHVSEGDGAVDASDGAVR